MAVHSVGTFTAGYARGRCGWTCGWRSDEGAGWEDEVHLLVDVELPVSTEVSHADASQAEDDAPSVPPDHTLHQASGAGAGPGHDVPVFDGTSAPASKRKDRSSRTRTYCCRRGRESGCFRYPSSGRYQRATGTPVVCWEGETGGYKSERDGNRSKRPEKRGRGEEAQSWITGRSLGQAEEAPQPQEQRLMHMAMS